MLLPKSCTHTVHKFCHQAESRGAVPACVLCWISALSFPDYTLSTLKCWICFPADTGVNKDGCTGLSNGRKTCQRQFAATWVTKPMQPPPSISCQLLFNVFYLRAYAKLRVSHKKKTHFMWYLKNNIHNILGC